MFRTSVTFGLLSILLLLSSCSGATPANCTIDGKAALMDKTQNALTGQDCAKAIDTLTPVYKSACSDNGVRMLMASAYGCAADINFLPLLVDLVTAMGSGSFFTAMAQLFPSVAGDTRVTAGQYGTDALMAVILPGSITSPPNQVGVGSFNPGSIIATDRDANANSYLIFMSMSLIGSLENQYGAPNATTFHRGQLIGATVAQPAGWALATNVSADACTYAASILNYLDNATATSATVSGSLAGVLGKSAAVLGPLINAACDAGCVTCGFPAGSCTPCPITLRNRGTCSGVITDMNTCSAAGIAAFINTNVAGWPDP